MKQTDKPREKRGDWKDIGFEHYMNIYRTLAPEEVCGRCKVPFADGAFTIRLMGADYTVSYPNYNAQPASGTDCPALSLAEHVLILRYLCEGRWTPSHPDSAAGSGQLSYREVPWGETYFANFDGRCIKRLARTFGGNPEAFCAIFETHPSLRACKLPRQTGYRFEFMVNLFFTFIIWPGDDEFPPQAQILFDSNIPAALSAEDLAAACDCAISRLKTLPAQ